MPIYEYKCTNCGEPVEKLQKLSDAPLTDCPACGQAALKRKVSAAGFRLSGGGWYETDFKSDKRRNLAGSGDPSSAKESSGKDSSAKDTSSSKGSSSNGESKPKPSESSSKPAGKSGGETKSASSTSKSSSASSD